MEALSKAELAARVRALEKAVAREKTASAKLKKALAEALQQQTATAEILKVISASPADVQPVVDTIAERAVKLCDAEISVVSRFDGELIHLVASHGVNAEATQAMLQVFPMRPSDETVMARTVRARSLVHIDDVLADPLYAAKGVAAAAHYRSSLGVPMLREGKVIGAIFVARAKPGLFSDKQVELMRTFADQAVIAIENVRLFNETKEALEQQTATGEILSSISGSITDTKPVFDAIVRNLLRLFGTRFAAVALLRDGKVHLAGIEGEGGYERLASRFPVPLDHQTLAGSVILSGELMQFAPVVGNPATPPGTERFAREFGFNSQIAAPMIREGKAIGAIVTAHRDALPFNNKQVALLKSFADQAVIAIENVRLFNETNEALEQQTATSEILRVISSSPTDTRPVFDSIVESAAQLCEARLAAVVLSDGQTVHLAATKLEGDGYAPFATLFPMPVERAGVIGIAVRDRAIVSVLDVESDPRVAEWALPFYRKFGVHSGVWVPMLQHGAVIGLIVIFRQEAGAFAARQLKLLKTFADQAVIAIENVRLFNETKEALDYQKAAAEILRVISNSVSDTQPVFDAIVSSCGGLFEGHSVGINIVESDGSVDLRAAIGPEPEKLHRFFREFVRTKGDAAGLTLRRRTMHFPDVEAEGVPELVRNGCRMWGSKAIVYAPMVSEGRGIGSLWVARQRAGPFAEKDIALLQTFADQAVIAIRNAQLFNDTREALEQQTATAEILRVISSTPTDMQPVFDAIVQSALRIFNGQGVGILLADGDRLQLGSAGGAIDLESARKKYPLPLTRESVSGQAILDRSVVNIGDIQAAEIPELAKNLGRELDYRAIASAPMLREGVATGAITVTRKEPGALSDKEIALLKTFADQAVIAIENVRLFKELEARTQALSQSVEQLTALGAVGQAISSSLDLETVLKTIVSRAVQLSGLDGGSIYEYDERAEEFRLQAAENMPEDVAEDIRKAPTRKGDGALGRTAITLEPTQVPDTLDDSYRSARKELLVRAGFRALLAVPLLRDDHLLGGLLVNRKTPGAFAPEVVDLLKTFAAQSALAIQNARLFREIAEKSRQLEVASRHKSDFLASMSHELRTPLNAILGFNEMILGEIYGEVPGDMREPLADIQSSGKHLLRLINNVLDLAKIEAGRMELALTEYSVADLVETVRSTLRPLAAEKGLEFVVAVADDMPLAYGDPGRITQCLMNLAGNALKFTRQGRVEIAVALRDGSLLYRVADTGTGIPPDKIGSLFSEFRQTDATIASEYGGTGLGLSITKKFVEMHGGRIWVESEPGKGSAFCFEVPVRARAGAAA